MREGDDSAANGTTYPDEVRTALRKLDEGALNEGDYQDRFRMVCGKTGFQE